jgi:hypothetical protein
MHMIQGRVVLRANPSCVYALGKAAHTPATQMTRVLVSFDVVRGVVLWMGCMALSWRLQAAAHARARAFCPQDGTLIHSVGPHANRLHKESFSVAFQ